MTAAAWALALTAGSSLAAEPRREAVVLPAVENMYSAPDATREVVSQATIGQVVAVLEVAEGFARIETPDRYRGWIPLCALLEYPNSSTPRYATKGTVAEVVSLIANVYRETSVTTARPKTQVPLGSLLEVTAESTKDGWHEVRLPSDEAGFVQAGDVRLRDATAAARSGTPEPLLSTARRLLGVPYLWGGMTPLGLDCSGLVSLVYHVNGRILPRDADLQFEAPEARPVERAELRAGDLVFFGKQAVTHVGLYLGDGTFISATTHLTPAVRVDRLDDPYWAGLYRGARRIP